jgi:hypothetical protein
MGASRAENLNMMEIFFEFFSQIDLTTSGSPSREVARKVALARAAVVAYYFTRECLSDGNRKIRIAATYRWILERFEERKDDVLNFPGLTAALKFLRNLPNVDAQLYVELSGELMFVCPKEVTLLLLQCVFTTSA